VGYEFESGHSAHITHICAHPDSNKVLTAAKDHTLREHDLRMHSTVQTFMHDDFRLGPSGCQPCYSPNAAYVVCGSVSGAVVIWNAKDGTLEKVLTDGHTRDVTACAWKNSGSEMLSVSKDKHFVIWG
jgi:WD40 repeat protein